GRSALDRADVGATRRPRDGGAVVTEHTIDRVRSTPGAGGALVEARDLSLSFGATPALRGASVSIAAGEMLAIMGPSGSGKSTLLHCLAGILKPDRGEVLFEGRPIHGLGETARATLPRARFGLGFRFGQLVPEL